MSPGIIKIGGSILRSNRDYSKVARSLAARIDASPTWVVVSAPYGLTEKLLELGRDPKSASLADFIEEQRLRSGLPRNPALEHALARGLQEVKAGRPASLVAWGEQASAAALRSCLNAEGIDVPIVELHARTRPPPWRDAVVPGFYLRDRHGHARLLPRGGTDISALLLGKWLGATEVRLWKDGGGIRDLQGTIPELSCDAALERIGKTIRPLHPAAVRIAAHAGIDILLEDPWQVEKPTRIRARDSPSPRSRPQEAVLAC